MQFRALAFTTLIALFALAGAAGAQDVDVFIDVYSNDYAEAWVSVPADTAVQAVELVSDQPGCEFAPAEEIEPGVWHSTAGAGSSYDCWLVTARVMLPGEGGGEVSWDQPCGPFIGLEKAELSGPTYTDSYDWEQGPYSAGSAGEEGHLCSNGKIKLSGSSAIHGDAWHGYHLKTSGSAHVTGEVGMLPEPIELSPVDPGDAALVNDNLSIPFSDKGNLPLQDGQLKLSGGESVALDPGTYFFSKLEISGGSQLHITGPTTIYVAGSMKVSGGSMVNESQNPSDLKLMLIGGSVKLSGSSDLHALVYGPDAKVERSGSSDFYGTIAAKQLKLSGSGGLHADGGTEPAGEPEVIEVVWVALFG